MGFEDYFSPEEGAAEVSRKWQSGDTRHTTCEMVAAGKKLLVLDVNGLLLDTYFEAEQRPDRPHDAKVNRFYVYKRNGCEDFMQFCLEHFVVGVWSSAREHNVFSLVEFMFRESKEKLAFIWHQMHCTDTKFKHPDNKHKPVFLKELSKLWDKSKPELPWEKGHFGPSNTVLIDDSPYKALRNPPHTGIFPESYKATDPEDNYLVGELRKYLEGLIRAADVQVYIEKNPFGVPRLAHGDQHYQFFCSVMGTTEIPALPLQPPASPHKQEEKVVPVADTGVALPVSDVFATSKRRRGKTKFGSTAEESLEYRASKRASSPRDFAERLSRALDASPNVACERDRFGGTNPPIADGILGRPSSLGGSQKSNSRDGSFERRRDRSRSRQPGHREGQFNAQSESKEHVFARHVQHNPRSGRRTSVIYVNGQRRRGGLDSQQNINQKSVNGNQWINPGLQSQHQYRANIGGIDTAMTNRWVGSGEWEGGERGCDPPGVDIRHRGASTNHPGRFGTDRPWHSSVPPYLEFNSSALVQGGGTDHMDDHSRRGWSKDSRSSRRGLSPYKGRPRDRLFLQKDHSVERRRSRDREAVYKETHKDSEFPLRAGPRAFDNGYTLGGREHEAMRRDGPKEHEDFDQSYTRPHFSHQDKYTRGRPQEKNPQASDPERVRGRSRHHEDVDRSRKRPFHVYDSPVEGVSNSVPYNEYDTYRRCNKFPRTYDARSADKYVKSRSRNLRETEKGQKGLLDSHVRGDDDIPGRNGPMSGRHYEQAHSRARNWNKWER